MSHAEILCKRALQLQRGCDTSLLGINAIEILGSVLIWRVGDVPDQRDDLILVARASGHRVQGSNPGPTLVRELQFFAKENEMKYLQGSGIPKFQVY